MLQQIRVTKIFTIEMAHVLLGYDGDCKNIHGHSYKLHITLKGLPVIDDNHIKNGMVIDFKELKKIVSDKIITRFDHALVINKNHDRSLINMLENNFEKIILFETQPTCELLLSHFANILKQDSTIGDRLWNIKLYETATSYAEWFLFDNI
jgi:6-pyruvoyltetrahydropterin/6-carboxytetrahydropterin synthase